MGAAATAADSSDPEEERTEMAHIAAGSSSGAVIVNAEFGDSMCRAAEAAAESACSVVGSF